MVRPSSPSRRNSSRTSLMPAGSSPLAGSSSIRTSGSLRRAAPMPNRCRIPREERRCLDDGPDPADDGGEVPRRVGPEQAAPPTGGSHQAQETADRRGLAGAVRPEEREDSSLGHDEIQAVDGQGSALAPPPVLLPKALHFDDRHPCSSRDHANAPHVTPTPMPPPQVTPPGKRPRQMLAPPTRSDQPRGRTSRTVVPRPCSLSAAIRPPCDSTRAFAMARPSPAPPESLAFTNRSNTWGRASATIPLPVSVTVKATPSGAGSTAMTTDPSGGVWRSAFDSRLASTSPIRTGSTSTSGSPAATRASTLTRASSACDRKAVMTSSTS